MDDLIKREAVLDYMKGWKGDTVNFVRNLPAVKAVPLDKLCEWLTAKRVSIPCRLCEYDDAGECTVQNDMSKPCPNTTRDWRRVITKWMEEQDAQKEN